MARNSGIAVDQDRAGVALVIVLALVVLLTMLAVAFFSRATTERQVSNNSAKSGSAEILALSGLNVIVSDFKQEILDGSMPSTGSPVTYEPTPGTNIVPKRSGTPSPGGSPIPNLIRLSIHDNGTTGANPMPSPGVPSRASDVSSTLSSANGRAISLARWNSHYLVPRLNSASSAIDSTPISTFTPPDWVLVTRNGPTPQPSIGTGVSAINNSASTNTNYVIGRYAYAVYDEGGMLDVNAVGVPSNMALVQYGRKGSVAFADLTATSGPNLSQSPQIDNIVGWRNYASIALQNNTPVSGTLGSNYSFTSANATDYFNYVRARTDGFLKVNAQPYPSPATTASRTDQAFLTRQDLLRYRRLTGLGQNTLEYLGTFSREASPNTPQWKPQTVDAVNPNFRTLNVISPFARNDGTAASVGEPLVKSRFLLQRLNWLTYKGPSGPSTANPTGRSLSDPDISLLINTYGLTTEFLQQGTDSNILHYFGLMWDKTNERWNYVGHSGGTSLTTAVATLSTLTGVREPDFFELLQAGILNSSLGDSSPSDPSLPVIHQQSKALHILTIGANLIAQARTDSFPVRIAFSNSGVATEAVGSPRLPYISALAACPVAATAATGGVNWFLVPNLWDPFRDNWDLSQTTALTPACPRPPVRITLNGTVGFGSAAAAQTGIAPAGSTTVFPTTLAVSATSLLLKTATSSNGRDGFREASRLGTSDFGSATSAFTVTTSVVTAAGSWNNITRPKRPDGTSVGTDNFVVFRFSIPGSAIASTANGGNPVLILRPSFQITVDYQSPNGNWYPYSFLQGNNASNSWVAADLGLVTTYSQYGLNPSPPSTAPTILRSGAAVSWDVITLAQAPMFAKGDPRSIRYNSQIGLLNVSSPPMSAFSAGVIGSIWPDTYATPPPMAPGQNPATYSQTSGDNSLSATNPYNESYTTGANSNPYRPIMMNRPFRSVGEMSYGFRDQPFKTIDFSSTGSPDAGLLDLFTVNSYITQPELRAGAVSLNTEQAGVLAAILKNTVRREDTARVNTGSPPTPSPAPSPIIDSAAKDIGTSLISITMGTPVMNRADITQLVATETGLGGTVQKTHREAIGRALGETVQTRTWNLMIDVIAQSGRYPPTASALKDFVVEGEKRYWLHVAIDRFTGEVVDQQLEAVYE
ncbi:MAG: hypothetical protein QOI07_3468 [Verrucomicrobiota bacterium]|jgi:hypothetical protein